MITLRSILFIGVITLMICARASAQGGVAVNANGSPADSSAILDASSTTKGMLVPRMTDAERNAIVNPAEGLLIFNVTSKCFNFFKTGLWWEVCGDCIGSQPPVVSNNGPVCSGDTLMLTATFVAGATYSWTGPNGFSSAQQNPVIPNASIAATGTYTVITNVSGCNSAPATTPATVYPAPSSSFTFLPTSPAPGQNVTFAPAVPGATYNWIFQNGNPATSTSMSPVVQWASVGTYDVTLTVTQNGCSSSTTSQIIISNYTPGTQTFNYTGTMQSFTVPGGVTSVQLEAYGAQGSGGNGGLGGYAKGTMAVTPGQMLYVYVGGQTGYNGGGLGHASTMRNGGGASDIRSGGTLITDRVIVAGGGGSSCGDGNYAGGAGGGGTIVGTNFVGGGGGIGYSSCNGGPGGTNGGTGCTATHAGGAGGGGLTSGGSPSCNTGYTGTCGTAGSLGQGGDGDTWENGVCYNSYGGTSGGGGGYYGGGGSSTGNCGSGGGGGGSSWTGTLTVPSFIAGTRSGDGMVVITW